MPTENATPNRAYPEPYASNDLSVDVARIVSAMRAIDEDMADLFSTIVGKASLASPAFTGTPTAPTAVAGTDSGQLATTAFVTAAVAALVDAAPGALNTLNELAAALGDDADFSATIAAALALRVRVDADQSLTHSQKGQGLANLGAGVLSGHRNKIINGDFNIWQRAVSQTSSGYGSDDRWANPHAGSTKTHSRQAFAPGQTDVPGNPQYFSRTVVTSSAGAGNYVAKYQRIEGVGTFAGKTATLVFYAKADAARNIALELRQDFGTGGSPSASVDGIGVQHVELTTSWQKFSIPIAVPSIAGKTLGSDLNDALGVNFWFDAGSTYDARTMSLGQQSGTFDIARVGMVEGDATAEEDPFSPRHVAQELALCQRYFERVAGTAFTIVTNFAPIYYYKVLKRDTPTLLNVVVNSGSGADVTALTYDARQGCFQSAGNSVYASIRVDADAEL